MSMLDLIMIFPTGFSASFLKIIKGKLTPEVAEYIDKNKYIILQTIMLLIKF